MFYLQGVHSSKVVVAVYGVEKSKEPAWNVTRRKHDSMSDAEEGETGDNVRSSLAWLLFLEGVECFCNYWSAKVRVYIYCI